jgi:membrane-bound lytic murein transglycosylase F
LKKVLLSVLIIELLVLTTCINDSGTNTSVSVDIKEIKSRGKIIAVTNYNTTDYFVYKGTPMGFQFEMLKRYAEYTGMQLEIIASNDMDNVTQMLLEGKCDIIAMNMPVTLEHSKYVAFTNPLMQTRQVLVQRSRDYSNKEENTELIKNPLNLAGKTVVVQRGTAFAQRLKNLSGEIGQHIDIIEVSENQEQLIQFVASGEIDYTVCDEYTALVNQKYFSNLDVETYISFPQNIAWAVRKSSNDLMSNLNTFLDHEKRNGMLAILKNKYYQNQWSAAIVNSDYFVLNSGQLSPYDDIIKKYSEELQWDWRLLAALIYQESNFDPSVKSYKGAIGLMQIMPNTALLYGVDTIKISRPVTNIAIGVKYLKWLDKKLENFVSNKEERIKFILAAYNIGIGHIYDAQLLAKKYGKNMARWDDVKEFMLNKSLPKYYQDSVVQFGYCNGSQTNYYVTGVLSCYMHYKNITSR